MDVVPFQLGLAYVGIHETKCTFEEAVPGLFLYLELIPAVGIIKSFWLEEALKIIESNHKYSLHIYI